MKAVTEHHGKSILEKYIMFPFPENDTAFYTDTGTSQSNAEFLNASAVANFQTSTSDTQVRLPLARQLSKDTKAVSVLA